MELEEIMSQVNVSRPGVKSVFIRTSYSWFALDAPDHDTLSKLTIGVNPTGEPQIPTVVEIPLCIHNVKNLALCILCQAYRPPQLGSSGFDPSLNGTPTVAMLEVRFNSSKSIFGHESMRITDENVSATLRALETRRCNDVLLVHFDHDKAMVGPDNASQQSTMADEDPLKNPDEEINLGFLFDVGGRVQTEDKDLL